MNCHWCISLVLSSFPSFLSAQPSVSLQKNAWTHHLNTFVVDPGGLSVNLKRKLNRNCQISKYHKTNLIEYWFRIKTLCKPISEHNGLSFLRNMLTTLYKDVRDQFNGYTPNIPNCFIPTKQKTFSITFFTINCFNPMSK